MSPDEKILQAGKILQGVMTDPAVPEGVKVRLHDAMHHLTVAVIDLQMGAVDATV